MAQGETPITIVGNVVADPELRYTSSGVAVSNFRVASTPRTFNKQSNQWEDAEALFLTVNVWREMAENVMETLSKGTRVMVTGVLRQRSYDTKDGQRRTVFEIEDAEVGTSLKFATAQVQRNQKGNGQQRQQPTQQSSGGFGASNAGSAYQPQQNTASNGGFGGNDAPPF